MTNIYRAQIARPNRIAEVKTECEAIAAEDRAGQAWSKQKNYRGYTSYASLNDLTWRSPIFAELAKDLDKHVGLYTRALDLDLGRAKLTLDSLWINILDPGGHHAAHIHPHSVVSGTFYVEIPKGASAIRFEDPRLPLMMAAPPRRATARRTNQPFITFEPKAGTLLLWESWLRHEVMINDAKRPRISVSFNYRWG
ncbi:MAG: TIGR02466 family protein [Hyphomicrobiaceae bacterium]